jgi:hypothetical protein
MLEYWVQGSRTERSCFTLHTSHFAPSRKRLTASLRATLPCRTKPICAWPGSTKPAGELCETKPNLGGMGHLGGLQRRVRTDPPGERAVQTKPIHPAGQRCAWYTLRKRARAEQSQFVLPDRWRAVHTVRGRPDKPNSGPGGAGVSDCGANAECVKQSQTWMGWGIWERGCCVQSGSATWPRLRNKANCQYPSKTIAKLRLTLPPRLSRAMLSNKANLSRTRRETSYGITTNVARTEQSRFALADRRCARHTPRVGPRHQTKPICAWPSGTEPAGELCETKPNLGGMGHPGEMTAACGLAQWKPECANKTPMTKVAESASGPRFQADTGDRFGRSRLLSGASNKANSRIGEEKSAVFIWV